tara:strand:+ start:13072 stop:13194 length:123 start_codon:yes stop_codon:yes gene_type:complete
MGIISVICEANSWNEMEDYAYAKKEFLRTFLKTILWNTIP